MKVEGLLELTVAVPGVSPAVSALNPVTSAAASVAGVPVATMLMVDGKLVEPVALAVPVTAKV